MACYRIEGIGPTGVERTPADYAVSVYPNPATDHANVRFTLPGDASGAVAVKIFDMSGRFRGITADRAIGGTQEIRVNTSELSPGEYLYQVVHGNSFSTGKLLIK